MPAHFAIFPRLLPTSRTVRRWLAAAVLTCMIAPPGQAQDANQAEQHLEHVRQELRAIARERRQLESQRGAAARQVRQADEQVAAAAHALRQIEAQLRQEQAELDALRLRLGSTDSRLGELRAELAQLVRKRYTRGERNFFKALFARERSEQPEGAPAYQEYLQHYLQQRITTLQDEVAGLETLESEMSERQRALETTLDEQRQRTGDLERERLTRTRTQAQLDSRYASHTAREHALGQDVRALEQLLTRLREASVAAPDTSAPLTPGSLLWPLDGPVTHHFGQRFADGRRSTGLLINAPPGAQVHAIADGSVVFSDWMTGYGMLLIIDHGHGRMSLYAHNESLLKQAGETIRRGDVIASVGHSGGQDTSGLYFELRHDGRPVNPEEWLRRD